MQFFEVRIVICGVVGEILREVWSLKMCLNVAFGYLVGCRFLCDYITFSGTSVIIFFVCIHGCYSINKEILLNISGELMFLE